MNNMEIYDRSKSVPANALRQIAAGRLKGKSDINPMWRLKMLTEQFGPCGIGWKYTIDRQWIENGEGVEKAAFVNISLYVKVDDQWSDGIPGTGGSAFVTQESKGPYTSDECYKMALTDAISVACKALGFGADVYWEADKTKYSNQQPKNQQQPQKQPQSAELTPSQQAFAKLQDWIDQASTNKSKFPDQEAFRNWFLDDNNKALVSQKQLLDASDMSAINRHFEQTKTLLPQRKNGQGQDQIPTAQPGDFF